MEYWRTLDELASTPAFEELLHREFPENATEWTDPVSRRQFLTLMGASLGLAGVTGCNRPPPEKIVPYVRQPEELVPGKPLFYATAMTLGGIATGILVEQHMGRPTKIEGNPDHPGSLGATDRFAQASILTLYDPDRSQTPKYFNRIVPWEEVFEAIQRELRKHRERPEAERGRGFRILTEAITSPTLGALMKEILTELPAAKWQHYEPVGRMSVREGARLAFGKEVHTVYRFAEADIILSLDADFLDCMPGNLRYVHDFTERRRVWAGSDGMNRLYVVEPCVSLTGAKADHRLPLRPSEMVPFTQTLAHALGVEKVQPDERIAAAHGRWIAAVAKDLLEHQRRCLVIPGDYQPPALHALAHAMNARLDNVGKTLHYTEPPAIVPPGAPRVPGAFGSLQELVEDMDARRVEWLLILGGNPGYTAPADFHFTESLQKVALRMHVGLYEDETALHCHWHIPEAHYLEAWGDVRGYDGTVTIQQPLIRPLYGSKSAMEILAAFTGRPQRAGYDLVRSYWRGQAVIGDDDLEWQRALHQGVVLPSPLRGRGVGGEVVYVSRPLERPRNGKPSTPAPQPLEIVFRPDPTIWDGQFANNAWLQELPKPLTKLTWDNAALMSPRTAKELGLGYRVGTHGGEHGEVIADAVELTYQGRSVQAAAWIVPGHPDGVVTAHFGYGRRRAGKVGTPAPDEQVGFNAYALRTSDSPWFGVGLEIRKLDKELPLACTQAHYLMENRRLVRAASFDHFKQDPHFADDDGGHGNQKHGNGKHPLTMYPVHPYPDYKWGMAIDLTACTGCGACVVACQAENNIPVVGKTEVRRGREMHWLRIDRYYKGDLSNPEMYFQPVPCMHCENAPCELVCPVEATVHSDDGLNDMVYNRCVGTRYCSNNCPYKVRRFNFLQYADNIYRTPVLKLLQNPDVTVRTRGVMEKCSYCVQRIRAADVEAEKQGRKIRDGEVVTACQAACPAQAIIFGDLNDPKSKVAQMKQSPLDYGLLADLNTRPRTTYLAAVRNPKR